MIGEEEFNTVAGTTVAFYPRSSPAHANIFHFFAEEFAPLWLAIRRRGWDFRNGPR